MKLAFTILTVLFLAAPPDEGQWLPIQIRNMDWKKLEARGMKLTKDQFWHPTKGGVLSAAVHLGGCTASFVSDEGLVVTNHHCGFGAIQRLSSVEKNYVRDGFVAKSRSKEAADGDDRRGRAEDRGRDREGPRRAGEGEDRRGSRSHHQNATTQKLVSEGQKEPNTRCMVASFFEGREYHLYYRTVITDVRLVYAPPRSVGEYGGEVDNWEWPRHTGDFSFFRAYVVPGRQAARLPQGQRPLQARALPRRLDEGRAGERPGADPRLSRPHRALPHLDCGRRSTRRLLSRCDTICLRTSSD